jgi:hypothetical protein
MAVVAGQHDYRPEPELFEACQGCCGILTNGIGERNDAGGFSIAVAVALMPHDDDRVAFRFELLELGLELGAANAELVDEPMVADKVAVPVDIRLD